MARRTAFEYRIILYEKRQDVDQLMQTAVIRSNDANHVATALAHSPTEPSATVRALQWHCIKRLTRTAPVRPIPAKSTTCSVWQRDRMKMPALRLACGDDVSAPNVRNPSCVSNKRQPRLVFDLLTSKTRSSIIMVRLSVISLWHVVLCVFWYMSLFAN